MQINISSFGWDLSSADPETTEDEKCEELWLTTPGSITVSNHSVIYLRLSFRKGLNSKRQKWKLPILLMFGLHSPRISYLLHSLYQNQARIKENKVHLAMWRMACAYRSEVAAFSGNNYIVSLSLENWLDVFLKGKILLYSSLYSPECLQ